MLQQHGCPTPARFALRRIGDPAGGQALKCVVMRLQRQSDLPDIVRALKATGRLASSLDRRKQQSC
jgi:hypothetical protein